MGLRGKMKKSKTHVSNKTVLKCITIAYNTEVDDDFGTSGDAILLHLNIHVTERTVEFIILLSYCIVFNSTIKPRP